MKDQASKPDSTIKKALRESGASGSSSRHVARRFSGVLDSPAFVADKYEKHKQAEESLRTVMYLSCWGPN